MSSRRGPWRASLAVAAMIAFGAVAGCGGDGGPTKEEFVKQAGAVCQRHFVKISTGASKLLAGGKLPSPSEFAAFAKGTIIPEYSAQIRELRRVEAPKDQDRAYRDWLDDSEALKARLERNPVLIQQPTTLADVNGQADQLGLSDHCLVAPG